MSRKEHITQGLVEIGACYAVTDQKTILPEDGFGAKPTYHVHPDASYPHQNNIITFNTLDEMGGYVKAVKSCEGKSQEEAYEIMQDFWLSLDK